MAGLLATIPAGLGPSARSVCLWVAERSPPVGGRDEMDLAVYAQLAPLQFQAVADGEASHVAISPVPAAIGPLGDDLDSGHFRLQQLGGAASSETSERIEDRRSRCCVISPDCIHHVDKPQDFGWRARRPRAGGGRAFCRSSITVGSRRLALRAFSSRALSR